MCDPVGVGAPWPVPDRPRGCLRRVGEGAGGRGAEGAIGRSVSACSMAAQCERPSRWSAKCIDERKGGAAGPAPGVRRPDRVGVQDRPRPLDSRRPQQAPIGPLDLGCRPGVGKGSSTRGWRAASTRAPESGQRRGGRDGAHHRIAPARNRVPARPARAATPAAARCGSALGGRLHPRADPARGSCCTAFVTGPVLPPHRWLGYQRAHGAPVQARQGRRIGPGLPTRARGTVVPVLSAVWTGRATNARTGHRLRTRRPPGQAIRARKDHEGGDLESLVRHSDHGSQYLSIALHRTTRRRGHRGIRRSRGIPLRGRRRPGPRQAPASAGPVLARRPLEGPRRPPGPPPPDR